MNAYKLAGWRNTLPVDNEKMIRLGFDLDGEVIRIKLPLSDAEQLIDSISDYIRDHSTKSHGIPSSLTSTSS